MDLFQNTKKGGKKLKQWLKRICGAFLVLVMLFSQGLCGYTAPQVQAADISIGDCVKLDENAVYRIVNVATGKCIDVPNGTNEDNTLLQSYTSNGTTAQQYKFIRSVDEGYYVIAPMCAQNRAIDDTSRSTKAGEVQQIYMQTGNTAQDFKVVSAGSGKYRIINRVSNMALQDEGSIQQQPVTDTDKQIWKIEKVGQTNCFTNPIKGSGCDPWVVKAGDSYYLCQSSGGVSLFKMNDLYQLGCAKSINIFQNDYTGNETLSSYWAPEVLYLQGRWYSYFAPEVNRGGNDSHRTYVLQGGSNPDDPTDGEYVLKGRLADPNDKWSIDATAFEYNGQLYSVWSGWEGDNNVSQKIYIATMSNPWTISSQRVCISTPTYDWETIGNPDVNEGPEVLIKNGKVHIIYSASGSWTDDYCLGRITCSDGNFLNPSSWVKASSPVFQKSDSVFGPGHASFVTSKDGSQDWIVYHAAQYSGAAWTRDLHMQMFTWNGDNPYFGEPIANGVEIAKPSSNGVAPVEEGEYYQIENVATGRRLDIPDGKDANSLQLRTWTANTSPAQQYSFKKASTGWYTIVPKCAQTRALDNPSGSKDKGKQYQTWTQNGNIAQNFRFEELSDGTFRIINQASLFALTEQGESSGYAVTQEALTNNDNQKWRIVKVNSSEELFDAATIPGTGDVLYSNDFSNSHGLQYYAGNVAGDASCGNNTLTISGGNANKIVVEDESFTDFVVEADIKVNKDSGSNSDQGGIIFRASDPYGGVTDGYNGYYFGIDAKKKEAILGKVHGNTWTEIAKKKMTVDYDKYYHVSVTVSGNEIECYVNYNGSNYAKVIAADNDFSSGTVGFRHWQTSTSYKNLKVSSYIPVDKGKTYTNAVLGGCADPDILYYDGVYYMYSTNDYGADNGIKVFTSTDLTNWTDRGYALSKDDVYGDKWFWAPDLIEKDGKFYMYYAANEHLSVATSDSPLGPFTQTPEERVPMHDTKEIDAHVFKDDDGQYYIYFVRFPDGNCIYGAKLNPDMKTIDESTLTRLISPTESWETDMAKVTEGPFMLKKDGVYYLTYSGSHFQSICYGSGYATSTSPLGTYTKYENNPIMQSNSLVHGAGHHCITESPDGKEMFIVYHCHKDLSTVGPRSLCIDRIQFTKDDAGKTVLEVLGPTITPQTQPSGATTFADTVSEKRAAIKKYSYPLGDAVGCYSREAYNKLINAMDYAESLIGTDEELGEKGAMALEAIDDAWSTLDASLNLMDGRVRYNAYRDFENDTIGDFLPYGIEATKIDNGGATAIVEENGNKFLRLTTGASQGHVNMFLPYRGDVSASGEGRVVVEYSARFNTEELQYANAFMARNQSESVATTIAFENAGKQHKIVMKQSASNTITPAEFDYNTWYDFKVVINMDAQTYTVYMNDTMIAEDYPFRAMGTTSLIGHVFGIDNFSNGQVDFDNFKVSVVTPGESEPETTSTAVDDTTTPSEILETTTREKDETTTKAPQPGYDPGFDPSGFEYKTITCEGKEQLALGYAIQSTTIEGLIPWYGDGGETLSLQFSAGAGEISDVLINGNSESGVVKEIASGLVKVDPTKLADNAYSVIEVTAENGKFVFVVKKGAAPETSKPDVTTSSAEEDDTTTSPEGDTYTTFVGDDTTTISDDDTTSAGGDETTKHNDETTTSNSEFDVENLDYTTLKCENKEELTLDYAVPSSTVEGLVPWYGDGGNTLSLQFSSDSGIIREVTVNGEMASDDLVMQQIAGLVKLDPTKLADNQYSVIKVVAENGEFTFVIKKGIPTEIITTATETTPEDTTTRSDVEITTPSEAVTTTPEGEETTAPNGDNTTTASEGGETTIPSGGDTTTVSEGGETTTLSEDVTTVFTGNETTANVNPTLGNTTTVQTSGEQITTKSGIITTSTGSEGLKVEKQILNLKNDKDPNEATFGKLRAQVKKSTKKSNKVTWKKLPGTAKYVIYGAKCGTSYKKITEVQKNSYIQKNLKKGTYYKYMVVAQNSEGKVLAISKVIHAATKGGKVGNCKSLKVQKKKIILKNGKKSKIKAKQIVKPKTLKVKNHRKISFESSNTKVAVVTKKGVIKAKKKGKCTIYVFAQNGIYTTVKVTVK